MTIRVTILSALLVGAVGCAQTAPAPDAGQSGAAEAPASAAAPGPGPTPGNEAGPPPPPAAPAPPSAPPAESAPGAGSGSTPPPPDVPPVGEKPVPAESMKSAPAPRRSAEAPRPYAEFREITVPAGTVLSVRLDTPLASNKNAIEDPVRGTVTTPVVISGLTAIPADAEVVGSVHEVQRSGRVKGRAAVAFRFNRLNVGEETHTIRTAAIRREAEPDRSDDVKKGAIGGAAGAIIGGIAGGGKGAVIGGAVGGTAAVMATRGDEITLPAGTTVRVTLQEPMKLTVPVK